MSPTLTPQEAVSAAQKGQLHPNVRQAIVDAVVHKKPKGWGYRSKAPYYTEFYARQMKVTVDEMLQSRKPVIFEYKSFPALASQTLYFRINQSMRYLVDCMDDDARTYGRFLTMIKVERRRDMGGIYISFKEEFSGEDVMDFKPRTVLPASEAPKWRARIDKYLEEATSSDKPLVITNLCLTPDEMKGLKLEFMGLQEVIVDITSSTVKIVKLI